MAKKVEGFGAQGGEKIIRAKGGLRNEASQRLQLFHPGLADAGVSRQVAGDGADDFVPGRGELPDDPIAGERTGAGEEDFHG